MIRNSSVERLAQIRRIFAKISDAPIERQPELLDTLCSGNPDLRTELENLLRLSGPADALFEQIEKDLIQEQLSSTDFDPVIGRTVAHFRILSCLGVGGMGIVYKARDTILGRIVALKFISKALSARKEARELLLHEAQAASALEHQNIGTIYEVGETGDSQVFIAMAYYPGESLRQKIDRGPLRPELALNYAMQLASALATAHLHDVVHRDVKPGNVFITTNDTLKLLDFGLANFASMNHGHAGTPGLGTLAYMSPEQARGDPVDHRTDIWSLGIVLYEMLTGRYPLEGSDSEGTIQALRNWDPDLFLEGCKEFPAGLRTVLARCLAVDPSARYQKISDLQEDLRKVASLPAGQVQAGRPARTRPVLIRSSIIAFASILLGVVGLIYQHNQQPPLDQGVPEPARAFKGGNTLAVLPFANLSGNAGQAYLVDGIHEGTVTSLSKVGSLKILARNSTLKFRDSELPISEIAQAMGAEYVLTGSVQFADDLLRVSVQLVDPATNTNLWADSYYRQYTTANVFSIQNSITQAISKALRAVLLPEELNRIQALPTANTEALENYYRGLEARSIHTQESWDKAIAYYKRAIELDPGFALAHAKLAGTYLEQVGGGWLRGSGVFLFPDERQVALAKPHVEAALALDDQLPEAYEALGKMKYLEGDGEATRQAFEKCIELDSSNANALNRLAVLMLEYYRRPEVALRLYEKAAVLDPENFGSRMHLLKPLRFMGRYKEYEEIVRAELERNPQSLGGHFRMAVLNGIGLCRYDEGIIWYLKYYNMITGENGISEIIRLYELLDEEEAVAWWRRRVINRNPPEDSFTKYCQAWFLLKEGRTEEAIRLLEEIEDWKELSEVLLENGEIGRALAICGQQWPDIINQPVFVQNNGNLTVVEDPFMRGQGGVLKVNPRDRQGAAYHVAARLPLPGVLGGSGPLSGVAGSKCTLYMKVARPDIAWAPGEVNIAIGLASEPDPMDFDNLTGANHAPLARLDTDGRLGVRDGSSFITPPLDPLESRLYHELWFVIDKGRREFDLHIRGGLQFPKRTRVFKGATFQDLSMDDLKCIQIVTSGLRGNDPAYLDDIQFDPYKENLDFPGVGWFSLDDFEKGDPVNWQIRRKRAITTLRINEAFLVARVLWAAGQIDRADSLFDQILEAIEVKTMRTHSYSMMAARVHAFRKNREGVLMEFRRNLERGACGIPRIMEKPEFDFLKEDPEFLALVETMEARRRNQRDRLRAMEARGQMPPVKP